MTRTVAYLRVSTTDQAEEGVSIEAQRKKVETYADLYDLDLVAVVEDAASAKTIERPGLREALDYLDRGEAEALVVAKLDRLTRSVADLGALVDRYFADKVALLSVAEQVDTRSAGGRLVLNVLTSVAQWEREAIGERTSTAMRSMRDREQYTGGHAPYGYRLTEDGELEEDEAEQAVIREAQRLKDGGLSLRKVARELVSRGFKTRKGGEWAPQQVKQLVAA